MSITRLGQDGRRAHLNSCVSQTPSGFGVRQSSGAFKGHRPHEKAPEDWRSPGRWRVILRSLRNLPCSSFGQHSKNEMRPGLNGGAFSNSAWLERAFESSRGRFRWKGWQPAMNFSTVALVGFAELPPQGRLLVKKHEEVSHRPETDCVAQKRKRFEQKRFAQKD